MLRMWGLWKVVDKDVVMWLAADKDGPEWTLWKAKARTWRDLQDVRRISTQMGGGVRAGAIDLEPKGKGS